MTEYEKFLAEKARPDDLYGFKPLWIPDFLFEFQKSLLDWSVRKGRAAIFADCGMGKSPMELVLAQNILKKENKPVLLLTPLAVGPQMVKEGEKFGIDCKLTKGEVYKGVVNVTNYEKIHHLDPKKYIAVICDEAGILKNYQGKLRRKITEFLHKTKYRLLATATPSPNDYIELGNSSEALSNMSRDQMLGMFFSNTGFSNDETKNQWELKGWSRKRFWQWICTWARAIRKPSDLGFNDKGFDLPELITRQHVIRSPITSRNGFFNIAKTLEDQRRERRETINERCEKVAELVQGKDFSVVWCHLNQEGNLLKKLIPGSVNVQGSDSDEFKEEHLSAFALGQIKVLITKPRIGGWGLNLQHCNHMTTFPSHSYESFYQSIRRCWRFGQKRPVTVDIVTSEAESMVLSNMKNKEKAADDMFTQLVLEMSEYQLKKKKVENKQRMILPDWLRNGKHK